MAIHDYHDHGDMGNYEAWKAEEELRKEKEERDNFLISNIEIF